MGTGGRGLPVCALAHPRARILSDNGHALSSQPNFAAFIKGLCVCQDAKHYVFAQGAARTRSGLSLPISFPLVKEIWAWHRLPKPCAQQEHGAAQQSRGTKDNASLACHSHWSLLWDGWRGSQTPCWSLILGEAGQWLEGGWSTVNPMQTQQLGPSIIPSKEVWLTCVHEVYLEPSHGLRAAVYLRDKSP